MGGGGGVAEGAAEGEAPEAKRETPRWDGIGVARSRKKGACRALRPRREWEEEAMGGGGWGLRVRASELSFPSCWPAAAAACSVVEGRRFFCLLLPGCRLAVARLYWAALCLVRR
jgi:hypothetical protein